MQFLTPKSGTHLLYQILYSIPGLQQWDDIVSVQSLCGIMNTPAHIRWKIGSAPDNSIVRSHLMYSEEILNIFSEHQCKLLFIYRDLRDVAVSHARWVTKEERIFLHKVYQQLPDFDQQLMKTIEGVPLGSPLGSNLSQPDIGQDFKRWQGWLGHAQTLAIRFEDLVGERGGGSEEKRLYLVEQILDHLGISMSSDQIEAKFSSRAMNPEESHTYIKGGKGSIGGWQKSFSYEHKQAFKRVAGKLLIDLGYETSFDW
ncbi:MAG: sulfotransferase domain-containing protein [Leptolyngbyaceae cyanobacterium SM2_5_2]|nr:sulfotransferase domain-containing protein [Leptolyngbyaceae cyanobacterium SM2_5_2]